MKLDLQLHQYHQIHQVSLENRMLLKKMKWICNYINYQEIYKDRGMKNCKHLKKRFYFYFMIILFGVVIKILMVFFYFNFLYVLSNNVNVCPILAKVLTENESYDLCSSLMESSLFDILICISRYEFFN